MHGLSCSDVPCPGGRFFSRWTTREVLGDVLWNLAHRKLGKGGELGAAGTVLSWDRGVLGWSPERKEAGPTGQVLKSQKVLCHLWLRYSPAP